MAELLVEPRKKTAWLPWLLLALGLIALIVFLSRRHNGTAMSEMNRDSSAIGSNTSAAADAVAATGGAVEGPQASAVRSGDQAWGDINRNAPGLAYGEIHGSNISVRGTENYAVYDLGEDVLFDKDKSTIRSAAADNLKDVAASIAQRFDKGPVRLYGFTDAQGSKSFNTKLAQARAEAVQHWLATNGNISTDRLSVEAMGESNPKATNSTEAGRQANRRVQIVVKKAG